MILDGALMTMTFCVEMGLKEKRCVYNIYFFNIMYVYHSIQIM